MNRIREIRKVKGISMEELAVKAGVGYSNLSRWERNMQVPCKKIAETIAKALDTTACELFPGRKLKDIG